MTLNDPLLFWPWMTPQRAIEGHKKTRVIQGQKAIQGQYSRGRLDPTIKNNCHIGHRKKIEPPTPKCNVSSRPSWSTTGYFGIIMHKRSIKRNTLYKLQRKKEGKWCLQVYAHHILVFSPLNCHMHHVECELKKFSAPSKNQKIKIWPTIIVRLHFLCINCWIKRVV